VKIDEKFCNKPLYSTSFSEPVMKLRLCIYIGLAFAFIWFIPNAAKCELKTLDDAAMSDVYAEGFAEFSFGSVGTGLTEAVGRFNINTYQFTEIASLKLGYHDEYDYKDPLPNPYGWDEDWENIRIGGSYTDPTQDFHTKGLFFKAVFENIDTPATRELKSITFGADYVEGPIHATFNSFSGSINDGVGAPEYVGHALNLGTKTINADPTNSGTDSSFSISLSIDGFDKGYWVDFTKATVTP
jgi:hypothetical protein